MEKLKQTEADRVKQMKQLDVDIQAAQVEMAKPPPKTEDPLVVKAEEVITYPDLDAGLVIH